MNWLGFVLTKELTNRIFEKAAQDGAAGDNSGQVRQVGVYRNVSLIGMALGAILGGACCFFHQTAIGLFIFSCFALLSVPVFCIQYNCLLTYDEKGFTWRNVMRISHRYSYEEITGLHNSPLRVIVELNNQKRLDFDESWINRQEFAQAIRKYRSRKPPKIEEAVLGMSCSEISESYENGILSKAMIVKEDDRSVFIRFKCIHYCICTLSCLFVCFALLAFPACKQEGLLISLILLVMPCLLLMIAALYLYFRYPKYFTAREKPSDIPISKNIKVFHKRCTLAWASLLCLLCSCFFFLSQMNTDISPWIFLFPAGAAALLLWGMLFLFRRFSWEYRNYRVGYVSFTLWQIFFSLSIFLILAGILLF